MKAVKNTGTMENCYTLVRLGKIALTTAEIISYYDKQLAKVLPKVLSHNTARCELREAYRCACQLRDLRYRAIMRWTHAIGIAADRLAVTFDDVDEYFYKLENPDIAHAIYILSTTSYSSAMYERALQ